MALGLGAFPGVQSAEARYRVMCALWVCALDAAGQADTQHTCGVLAPPCPGSQRRVREGASAPVRAAGIRM